MRNFHFFPGVAHGVLIEEGENGPFLVVKISFKEASGGAVFAVLNCWVRACLQ